MMEWEKLGLVYAPKGEYWWAKEYAHLPTAEVVNEEFIRVYFASLDENKHGRIGFVDVDIDNPTKILSVAKDPILDIGEIGAFDDSGVNPSCIVNVKGKKYLYYIGWQRCERVPYMLFAGLAEHNEGEFKRLSQAPVLERTLHEPFIRSAVSIIFENDLFKAWYVSGLKWITISDRLYPQYIIRYAHSVDGKKWTSTNDVCINFKDENEFGFGRPWVIKDGNLYRMWYSIRSLNEPYRLGYAESGDGITWKRLDDRVGIARSEKGWDSEMICYPCVVTAKNNTYLFYNGNQHGYSGFGCARL